MTPLEVVKSFYANLGSGNVPAALEILAPSVTWTEMFPGYEGAWTGAEATQRNLFEPLGRDWEAFVISPESFVAEGPSVVAFGTYDGVFKKTGKSMSAPFVHRWEISDGRAINMRQYTDTALIQAART